MTKTKSSVRFILHESNEKILFGKYGQYIQIVFAWLMFAGLGQCFIKTFELPCAFWFLALAAACVLVLQTALRSDGRRLFLGFCAVTVGSLLVWALSAKYTRAGITIISNAITRLSSVNNLEIIPQYQITVAEGSWSLCVTLFFFPLAVLLAFLCGTAVRHEIVAFPLAAVAVLLCVMVTFKSYGGAIWLAPVFLAICLMITSRGGDSAAGAALLIPTGAMLLGCAVLWLFSLGGSSSISAYFSAKKADMEHRAHVAAYENGTQAMPEGRLNEATGFSKSGSTALTVTLKKPCSMYLRGFTGGVLTRDGWSTLSGEEFYDSRALFYNLHKSGFYPQSQMNALSFAADYADEEKLCDMEISVGDACSAYIYTPYEFCDAEEAVLPDDVLGDTAVRAVDADTYHYRVQPRLAIKYPLLSTRYQEYCDANVATEAFSAYRTSEERYRNFVYTHYLDIDGQLLERLEEHLAKGADIGESHLAYSNAKAIVQSFLVDHMEYSTSPTKAFDGTAATLENILTGKGDGYSAHYASIAAVLMRYYGIPTRYVEGYIITSADAKAMKDGEPYSIPMSQAHAWVEYYHDGVGWVPFEVTPGYEDLMDETKDTSESDSVNNPTEAPEHTEKSDSAPPQEELEVSFAAKILIALAVLIILWFVARYVFLKYLERERNDGNCAEAVRAACRHTLRVLSAMGYAPGGNSLYDLLPALSAVAEEPLLAGNFRTVADLANKATFSNTPITPEEAEQARQIFAWYTAYCTKTLPTARRLLVRYGMWVY